MQSFSENQEKKKQRRGKSTEKLHNFIHSVFSHVQQEAAWLKFMGRSWEGNMADTLILSDLHLRPDTEQ